MVLCWFRSNLALVLASEGIRAARHSAKQKGTLPMRWGGIRRSEAGDIRGAIHPCVIGPQKLSARVLICGAICLCVIGPQ